MMMGFGGMWLWMILGLVALWALAACAIRWTIGSGGPRGTKPGPVADPDSGATPVQLLDARLARGEISAEEYRRVRDLLSSGH